MICGVAEETNGLSRNPSFQQSLYRAMPITFSFAQREMGTLLPRDAYCSV
jgi:hypothetical protein